MNETEANRSLGTYGAILRRRWRVLLGIVPSALLLAIFLAYALPARYTSSAAILLEPSSIPEELIKTTVISYADQQIELVRRTVMTTERLEKVVEKVDPYPGLDVSAREKASMIADDTSIEKVDPVTLKPLPESAAFAIYYVNPDPEIARDITRQIADLFLQHNLETRTQRARETFAFLSNRSKEIEERIRKIDQQVSEFKARHGGALPESRPRNELAMDRAQRDLDAAEAEIRVQEQQEQLLQLQISQINPMLVASAGDSYTSIGQVRAELAAAQQKYTPDHPDVKRLTRALESLIAQNKVTGDGDVRADNPEYLRVAAELASVKRNLAALRATAARARNQLLEYENHLGASPVIERDYVRLQREREVAQEQFADVQAKLREADDAQRLESQAMGERYTLIRNPFVPTEPSSPNRLGIIMLGLLLGGALGIGLAIAREGADPTVRGLGDITSLGEGLSVLGAVPSLRNGADQRRFKTRVAAVAGAYGLAMLVVAITIANA